MASPVAPPGFQGDLVDPATGQRRFRIEQEWERLASQADAFVAPVITPTPAPVPFTPTTAEIPSQESVRWIWTAHGYYPFRAS